MKRFLVVVGVAVLAIGLSACPGVLGDTSIEQTSPNEYSISSEFFSFLYTDNTALSIQDYKLWDSNSVFESIRLEYFSPVKEPYVDPTSSEVVAEGQYAVAKMHSNPAATMNFDTHIDNLATLRFSQEIGAINLGSSLFIGNEDMKAEIVLRGSGNISKGILNEYSFAMRENSSLIFRNNFIDQQPIGDSIAQEVVAGELFISQDENSIVEDLMDYLPISMRTISSSDEELKVDVSGDFDEGKVLIFDISKDILSMSKDDLKIRLDDTTVESSARDKVLEGSGNEPIFTVMENEDYFQVYLYSPSWSTHTVTFGRLLPQTPMYGEIMIGLGIAAAVSAASAALMFRRKKDY
jgi:hypothetical protein